MELVLFIGKSKYNMGNLEYPWIWGYLSANVTWEIVISNPNFPWICLSFNPNITWKIIRENQDKPWNWELLSNNNFGVKK